MMDCKCSPAPWVRTLILSRYIIRQYGHLPLQESNKYRLELTLERVAGQRPMDTLFDIPRPSELDDWQYYNRVLAEDIRANKGDIAYSEWKENEEKQEREREQWRQWHDFRRHYSQVGWVKPRMSSSRRSTNVQSSVSREF